MNMHNSRLRERPKPIKADHSVLYNNTAEQKCTVISLYAEAVCVGASAKHNITHH